MKKQDQLIKQKAMAWANTFEVCCVFDTHGYSDPYPQFDLLIAAGAKKQLRAAFGDAFEQLKVFYEAQPDWMFGLLGYDLKNEIENLKSENPDHLNFPDLFFFIPEYLIRIKDKQTEVLIGNQDILSQINQTKTPLPQPKPALKIESRITKSTYLSQVKQLQQHIKNGDIYEVTFCQEFFAKQAHIDPLAVYQQLNKISPSPFSGFFKIKDQYILSASPERFLSKRGNQLLSQPIKGTAKRSEDPTEDAQLKNKLKENSKEQAENVMIVDLVRNDLTKSAIPGTVKVTELFGVYSFPQVHQLISTITCNLNPEIHFIDAIKNTFPMGSMTGAPKIRAMELIEKLESSKRGAYSGSMGYFTPDGDFDLNVIIRSILYDATTRYLSFQVGGAITYESDAESEYEECLLKASAMVRTLKGLNKQPF